MRTFLLFMVLTTFETAIYARNNSRILESVTASERAMTLATIINRTGRECDEVIQTFLQGYDKEEAAYWNVSCSNGKSYNVQVQSDPNTNSRVLECEIMKTMGVECFKKFNDR